MLLLSSVAGLPLISLADSLRQELSLLGQEAGYYTRKASEAAKDKMGAPEPSKPQPSRAPVDAELGALLLAAPLDALDAGEVGIPWSRAAYAEDYARLMAQELPYYQQAGTCGHCGASDTLDDAAWVDFRSYIQWKAISRQLTGYRSTSAPAYWEAMHAPMPTNDVEVDPSQTDTSKQLRRAVGRRLLAAAQAAARADGEGGSSDSGLLADSPALDSIRLGVRQLLRFFKGTGLMDGFGFVQFGMSGDPFENYATWEDGEPAFVKYWLKSSLAQRSGAALEEEEGFSQDFVGSAVEAYLEQCGVALSGFRRVRSLSNPQLEAEQATLRRVRELPAEAREALSAEPFKLDLCPDGQETGCY